MITKTVQLNGRRYFSGWALGYLLIAFSISCAHARAETGWQVMQVGESCPMGSGTIVTISSNGMKVTGPQGRIVMLTCGPAWDVTLINHQARLVYKTTLNDWLKTAKSSNHSSLEGASWKRGTTETIARTRAYSFIMDKPPTRGIVLKDGTTIPPVKAAKLWVAQDIATSPSISSVFSKLYGIPDCQRLPLRLCTGNGTQGSTVTNIDTVNIGAVPVNTAMFQSPTGYKPVASYIDVITGASETDDLKKILKD